MKLFAPDFHVSAVWDLSPDWLAARDIAALVVDADCTLKRYRAEEPLPEAAAWIAAMRSVGIKLCLVSNGRSARIERFAQRIELPFVANAMKPLPGGCRAALSLMQAPAHCTAIVGDQVLADLLAGRLAGLRTILVRPIHPEDEPWFTRLKRPLERLLIGRRCSLQVPQRSSN